MDVPPVAKIPGHAKTDPPSEGGEGALKLASQFLNKRSLTPASANCVICSTELAASDTFLIPHLGPEFPRSLCGNPSLATHRENGLPKSET